MGSGKPVPDEQEHRPASGTGLSAPGRPARSLARKLGGIVAGLALSGLGGAVALAFVPLPAPRLIARPAPVPEYDEAARRVEMLRRAESGVVDPRCGTKLLTQGHRTPRVVVFFHGFTNCPRQFEALAETVFATGDNVLLVRMPEHGLADRHGPTLGRLGSRELVSAADSAIDVARGLGDTVVVAGLSVGGLSAAWTAEERGEVARAVLIAPMFGLPAPKPLERLLVHVWSFVPDAFVWWDPRVKEALPGPTQTYFGWSTRSMAGMIEFAVSIERSARERAPHATDIVLVTNAADRAVSNGAARDVLEEWRRHAPGRVREYEFPNGVVDGHDIIDPEQPYANVRAVYPVLVDLLHGGDGSGRMSGR